MSSSSNKPKKKIYQVKVDRKTCIGAATCVVVSPQGFDLDEESIAIPQEGAEELSDDNLFMAAQSCPVQAIMLFDKKGNQIFPKA
jgi:ferredoxin